MKQELENLRSESYKLLQESNILNRKINKINEERKALSIELLKEFDGKWFNPRSEDIQDDELIYETEFRNKHNRMVSCGVAGIEFDQNGDIVYVMYINEDDKIDRVPEIFSSINAEDLYYIVEVFVENSDRLTSIK